MIASFKSKALKRLWTRNDGSKIRADWLPKVALMLDRLNASTIPEQLDLPGFGFHPLTGDRAGTFAILVSRNWRITFRWDGEDARDVDLEDYHGR